MKIAQIAPLIESVPPRLYGGTERIVSYLTEELVALGHEVTLFASGDSDHCGQSCALRAEGAAARRRRPRSDPLLHADARPRAPARRRFRRSAASISTSFSFPLFRSITGRPVRHAPWPVRPARISFRCCAGFFDSAARLDLRWPHGQPVPKAKLAATVFHRLSAFLHGPSTESTAPAIVSHVPRPRLAETAGRSRSVPDCACDHIPLKVKVKIDRARRGLFPGAQSTHCWIRPAWSFYRQNKTEHQKTHRFFGEAQALLFPSWSFASAVQPSP